MKTDACCSKARPSIIEPGIDSVDPSRLGDESGAAVELCYQCWDNADFIRVSRHFITESFCSLVYPSHPLTVLGDGRLYRDRNKIQVPYRVAATFGDDRTMLIKDIHSLFVECNHEAVDTQPTDRNEWQCHLNELFAGESPGRCSSQLESVGCYRSHDNTSSCSDGITSYILMVSAVEIDWEIIVACGGIYSCVNCVDWRCYG